MQTCASGMRRALASFARRAASRLARSSNFTLKGNSPVEVVKALAALKPLYGKDNVEIVTEDGQRVRGLVKSMRQTQALTTPRVKMQRADGEIVKIAFNAI